MTPAPSFGLSGERPNCRPGRASCSWVPDNEVYLSVVSAWEIALKHAAGRLPLPESPERFVPAERRRHGIDTLGLDEETALHLGRLPPLHRDPFDRMLVCQAIVHGLVILGPDTLITQYPIRAAW